jgi:hypothetical protein
LKSAAAPALIFQHGAAALIVVRRIKNTPDFTVLTRFPSRVRTWFAAHHARRSGKTKCIHAE